nr:MAG TPA: Radical SAM superfamily [Caudoviricetes sp.]
MAFFVCITGKSIEPADLAELVKGAAQCSYRCGECTG